MKVWKSSSYSSERVTTKLDWTLYWCTGTEPKTNCKHGKNWRHKVSHSHLIWSQPTAGAHSCSHCSCCELHPISRIPLQCVWSLPGFLQPGSGAINSHTLPILLTPGILRMLSIAQWRSQRPSNLRKKPSHDCLEVAPRGDLPPAALGNTALSREQTHLKRLFKAPIYVNGKPGILPVIFIYSHLSGHGTGESGTSAGAGRLSGRKNKPAWEITKAEGMYQTAGMKDKWQSRLQTMRRWSQWNSDQSISGELHFTALHHCMLKVLK